MGTRSRECPCSSEGGASKPYIFNVQANTKILADASSLNVLGVVLNCQIIRGNLWHMRQGESYISSTKERHTHCQVEKEALAVTWACEKFWK